jgi:hypothetical protein
MTTGPRTEQIQRTVARVVAAGAVAMVVLAGTLGSTAAQWNEAPSMESSGVWKAASGAAWSGTWDTGNLIVLGMAAILLLWCQSTDGACLDHKAISS